MTSLSGKTALVTGASRGIGRAAALALAKRGAQIIVHYGKAKTEADAVVAAIRAGGGKADSVATDLAAPDSAEKLAQHVRDIVGERLDILIANAGIFKVATLEETKVEDFDQLFAVNVRAPFFLVQQLLPILGEGSSVIVTSSVVAHTAFDTLSCLCDDERGDRYHGQVFCGGAWVAWHPRERRRPGCRADGHG